MRAVFLSRAVAVTVLALFGHSFAHAHTPVVDSALTDWCVGATSNTAPGGGRVEDRAVTLTCGNCSVNTTRACVLNTDCPAGQTCVNLTSKVETAFWDNRTDGAVNDLGTVVMTQNATNLYIGAELWVDPDPQSLPFGMIAIDFRPGGVGEWHDPNGLLVQPGRCSVSTSRACTTNADCHFCNVSDEPTGGCSVTTTKSCVTNAQCPVGETCIHRLRACGSACDVGDTCNQTQTCTNLGAGGLKRAIGFGSSPGAQADFLVVFDFSLWLIGAGDAVQLMRPRTPADPPDPTTPWIVVSGPAACAADGDPNCDFAPAVNPGASGGSGGPPGSVEVAIPWAAIAGSGLGPNVPFRYTMTIARGTLSLDFKPDGAHEDLLSESVAGASTTTTNSCPGMGVTTTFCELANGSSDAFLPRTPPLQHETPGGRVSALTVSKGAGGTLNLGWGPSCAAGDTDYGVYQGTIGSWYSHAALTCSTGGTTANFLPGAGNRYYLVVPHDASVEGSYGKDDNGLERPTGASACEPQVLGTCP
jgi:hypothetical protein